MAFGKVTAKRTIQQSPLSDAPDVPKGTAGFVQDETDGYLFVDFDGAYGVVCCEPSEVNGPRGSRSREGKSKWTQIHIGRFAVKQPNLKSL